MENSKTIVCPNCGAVSTNLDNCEYCGSILVKLASLLQAEGKDVSKELKEIGVGKKVYTNPIILSAVKMHMKQSNKFDTEIYSLFSDRSSPDGYFKQTLFKMELDSFPNSAPILKINFDMTDEHYVRRFHFFENHCDIYQLFEVEQDDCFMKCSLQLDNDVRLTAQLIRYVITGILGFSDAMIGVSTYVELNDIIYLIAPSELNEQLEEFFNRYYLKWETSSKNTTNIKKEQFVETREWMKEFFDINNIHEGVACHGEGYWISEKATKKEINEILNGKSNFIESKVYKKTKDNTNVVTESTIQHKDFNNNPKMPDTSAANFQDIAKQFVETLGKEVQAKTNIKLSSLIIAFLIFLVIILLVI